MPIALLKYVREVSSEDDTHCARNLLQEQPGKKWKTKTVGEKSAYVIFEMEKPQTIIGIDIGNEHSAFIEVLVSSSGCREEDFSELLLSCSFMTPTESKNSTTINRVRCFNKEALVQSAVSKKWKMVKIICTQPYNKHVQYGLSFIKLNIATDKWEPNELVSKNLVPTKFLESSNDKGYIAGTDEVPEKKILMKGFPLGKFVLRPESPDSESESTPNLFSRWRNDRGLDKSPRAPSPAANIRQASNEMAITRRTSNDSRTTFGNKPHLNESKTDHNNTSYKDRNREELLFGDGKDECKYLKEERLENAINNDRKRLEEDTKKREESKDKSKEKASKEKKSSNRVKSTDKSSMLKTKNIIVETIKDCKPHKRPSSEPEELKYSKKRCIEDDNVKYRPFNKLLNGVVLVISGIQNPERSNLRSKAIELGATYKADWQSGCTHLICTFKNTPKYNQVKGKGKIVKSDWIENCYRERKYIPWRRFALDADLRTTESDEEIFDESTKNLSAEDKEPNCSSISKLYDCSDKESDPDEEYGQDTDDEIERVNKGINHRNENPEKSTIYDEDTVEEDYLHLKLKTYD